MAYAEIPRGLSDLQVSPLVGDVPGTWVDVPGPRILSFNVESDSDELEGGNQVIAKVSNAPTLSGNIEVGKINMAAMAVLIGSNVETEGDPGDAVTRLVQKGTVNVAYFTAAGQAPGVDVAGSAYRVILPKLITTSGPSESLEVNSWNTPTVDFEGLALNDELVIREQWETETPLPPAP